MTMLYYFRVQVTTEDRCFVQVLGATSPVHALWRARGFYPKATRLHVIGT